MRIVGGPMHGQIASGVVSRFLECGAYTPDFRLTVHRYERKRRDGIEYWGYIVPPCWPWAGFMKAA